MRKHSNMQDTLAQIHDEARALFGQGNVANYIPALAKVDPRQFGIAVAFTDGSTYAVGDAHVPFSLQSISKLFTFVLALKTIGGDVWKRVGREPSGAAFNSMVQLETEHGVPRNPFINAGALVITDILTSHYAHLDYALLGALRRLTGDPKLNWNAEVAKSERGTSHRNMAMAYFMKSCENFHNAPELVLDKQMDGGRLFEEVGKLAAQQGLLKRMGDRARTFAHPNAAKRAAEVVESLIGN